MASFNLGRIKGDRGEMGPVGETGPKGDKGDKGDNGTDGSTPVFSVGKTETVPSSGEAYVEINTDNPENPVLSFYIPRGKDGQDASGDMLSAIYDEEGIKKDIYKYANELFSQALKISGGILAGELKASESELSEGLVRNISVRSSLPESAANGDICIILYESDAKKLGNCATGTVVLLEEQGNETEYLIIGKDYHKTGGVTLVRKKLAPYKQCFDLGSRSAYPLSDIDITLETTYKNLYSKNIRDILVTVTLDSSCYRQCFMLSQLDLINMEYFTDASKRIAREENSNSAEPYFTRSFSGKNVYTVGTAGNFETIAQSISSCYRPAVVLPADLVVANTVYNNSPAVKLPDTKSAVYIFCDGEWKECP